MSTCPAGPSGGVKATFVEALRSRVGEEASEHDMCADDDSPTTTIGATAPPTSRRVKRRGSAPPSPAGVANLIANYGRRGSDALLWIVGSPGCLSVCQGGPVVTIFIRNGGLATTATRAALHGRCHGPRPSTPTNYRDEYARLGGRRGCTSVFLPTPIAPLFILPER